MRSGVSTIGRRLFNRLAFGVVPVGAALVARGAVAAPEPDEQMTTFLNGFHFYADDMGRQIAASHVCTHLSEDVHQCVIYDSRGPGAKLIGIEYIVSARVFATLPDDEKRLWHSHHYEVKSGQLIAPALSQAAEHAMMAGLVTSYGKTWHCWQIDRDQAFPFGIPQLMMGFTQDGQLEPSILAARDRAFEISSGARAADRADIPMPTVQQGANGWQSGHTLHLKLEQVPVRNER